MIFVYLILGLIILTYLNIIFFRPSKIKKIAQEYGLVYRISDEKFSPFALKYAFHQNVINGNLNRKNILIFDKILQAFFVFWTTHIIINDEEKIYKSWGGLVPYSDVKIRNLLDKIKSE